MSCLDSKNMPMCHDFLLMVMIRIDDIKLTTDKGETLMLLENLKKFVMKQHIHVSGRD